MSNTARRPGYPRKVAVLSDFGFIETLVNDVLPHASETLAVFQAGSWSTFEMRKQVFEAFKPYAHPREKPWVFGYHEGKYQAKKLSWRYAGYEASSWTELLNQIVRCYYTYA